MTLSTTTLSSSTSVQQSNHDCLNNDIPHEFICPITQEMMKNPLMSRYGQTYERDAILTWLSNHNNLCPLTRQVLNVSDLIRNRTLLTKIEVWKKLNGLIDLRYGHEDDSEDSRRDGGNDYDDMPCILLTCRKTDFLSFSDHNPIKEEELQREEESSSPTTTQQQQRQQQQSRLHRRILQLIRSSR